MANNNDLRYKHAIGCDFSTPLPLPPSGSYPLSNGLQGIDFDNLEVCQYLMSKIKWSWLCKDVRLAKLINDRVIANERKKAVRRLVELPKEAAHYHCLTGALLAPVVLPSMLRLRSASLASLSELKIHCLLCAWVLTKGNEKVFSTQNIADFKTYDFGMINKELVLLCDMGLIDLLSDVQIHKYSGKFAKRGKGSGRGKQFYRISRRGNSILKDYFTEYEKIYERVLNEKFAVDLLSSLDTPENEDTKKDGV